MNSLKSKFLASCVGAAIGDQIVVCDLLFDGLSLRGAQATKQSLIFDELRLLRFARNDCPQFICHRTLGAGDKGYTDDTVKIMASKKLK